MLIMTCADSSTQTDTIDSQEEEACSHAKTSSKFASQDVSESFKLVFPHIDKIHCLDEAKRTELELSKVTNGVTRHYVEVLLFV